MYIRSFKIENFRSLKVININRLNPITLFHGDNDVGKSNIIAALEIIFKSKEHDETVSSPKGRMVSQRILGFWEGSISNFGDNFHLGSLDSIKFSVTFRFETDDLNALTSKFKETATLIRPGDNPNDISIKGKIERAEQENASQSLEEVKLNNHEIYQLSADGGREYVTSLSALELSTRYGIFEELLSILNDAFIVVPAQRYLTTEVDLKGQTCLLEPNSFKNWLHNLEMDRRTNALFEEIKRLFQEPPFNFGEIGFARIGNNLEIMVNRPGLRLPIGRLGTGVQQILMLLAHIVYNRGKIVGIEELEVNLSEKSQNNMLKLLDELIRHRKSTIRQVLLTTHSYEYGREGTILRWFISNDGEKTSAKKWDNTAESILMRTRMGRLMTQYDDAELKDILVGTLSEGETKDLFMRLAKYEDFKKLLSTPKK